MGSGGRDSHMDFLLGFKTVSPAPHPLRSRDAWQALTQDARDTAYAAAQLIAEYHFAPDDFAITEVLTDLHEHYLPDFEQTRTHLHALAAAGFATEQHGLWAIHPQTLRFLAGTRMPALSAWSAPLPEPGLLPLNAQSRQTSSLDDLIPWTFGDLVHTVTERDDFSVLGAVAGDLVVLRVVGDPNEHDFEDVGEETPSLAWGSPRHLKRWTEDVFGYRLVAHIRLGQAASHSKEVRP